MVGESENSKVVVNGGNKVQGNKAISRNKPACRQAGLFQVFVFQKAGE